MAMTLSRRRPLKGEEPADGGREGTPVVEDHALRSLSPVVPGNYPADLDSIIISTAELGRRSSRPPDHAAENQALLALARELATSPKGILQKLAETALGLCRAQSACVSLLDDTRKNFYWRAVAGQWACHLGVGTPRDFGPCGTVLDRDVPLLFSHPERVFTYLAEVKPYIEEGLLFPFEVDGQAVGTIWVVNHDRGRQFDAEDMRLLGGLADFAAAAYQSFLASTKVRDSERRLRQIIDALPAAIYTTDAEGRVTMFNEAAATFAGRTPQLGSDSWCVTWRLFWPDGTPMPHDQCPMATAVKERRPIRGMEGIVERPDGTRRRFIPYPTPLFDSSGTMVGAVNMAVDITEQVEARRALADSEARFRATFENAAVGVAVVGPDGSILRANNSFARMLGYSVEELKTGTFQEVTHPDDLATNLSVLNKALVGEADSYSIEKRYVRKDGGIVWASLTVGCVRKADGGIDYFVSVIQDITDRKRAEARLAERNAQLDLAGKIARIGSFTYDHPTRKLQLSPGCAAIYGLREDTREISREDWRARVQPDDLLRLDTVTRCAITNGERECILEFRIFRHGQVRWIESRILISYNEAGKPVRTIGAEIDVTERKQAELALAERNMQFTLAGKAALVGSYAYDVDADTMQVDEGYAELHGLPGTSTTRSEWKTRAHPEDLDRIETVRSEAFRERRSEYGTEYRIVRSGGQVRWIEFTQLHVVQ